tara:strand:+ start:2396 stop:4765 length:2370 start_codon:yes stop_codon:yes gene_type:complete
VANYNVDIDVAVRGYNRVEQNLKKLDRLIGKPRVLEINPGIQFRKFRQEKLQLLKEMRRAGAESAVAFQQAFEREARIARQVAGAGSRTLPPAAGPIALLPPTAIGQFQKAANLAAKIDLAFARAKGSVNEMAITLGGARFAGTSKPPLMLPPAGGFGGGAGGGGGGFGSFTAPGVPGPGQGFTPAFNPNMYASPIGPKKAPFKLSQAQKSAAITGGAFPLLFGGGFGQAAGGAIGGAVSGKMFGGLTVGLQVVGMAVDSMVASTIRFGETLGETDTALQSMTERSLFSTKATQKRAEELQALGETEELANLLTAELATTIGTEGVKAFQDLGDESSEFNTLINKIFLSLQALIAGPLAGFLSLVNTVLSRDVSEQSIRSLKGSLQTPEGVAAFEKRVKEIAGTEVRTLVKGKGVTETKTVTKDLSLDQIVQLQQEVLEGTFGETNLLANKIKASVPTPKKTRTKKERESRVPQLTIEVGLTERLNTLNRQILQAKQDEDPVREAALQMEVAMEKEAAKIAKINLDKIPQAEKDLQIKEVGLQTDQEIFEINERLKALRQAQAEKNQEIIADFQSQNDLLQAQLDGRLEEEQIEQQLAKLKAENEGLDIDKIRNILEANKALKEQIAIAEQLDQVYATIGQSISSSIVDALTAAVDETKSLADIASQTLRQIANILLQFGVQTALSSLGGNDGVGFFSKLFPKKALGGPVGANQPYMVGEKGPELFVPGAQGNIVPNNAMGGSKIVVNVDASGSSVQGDGQQGKALGQAIGAAVQAEIIKQKMPGGLLN